MPETITKRSGTRRSRHVTIRAEAFEPPTVKLSQRFVLPTVFLEAGVIAEVNAVVPFSPTELSPSLPPSYQAVRKVTPQALIQIVFPPCASVATRNTPKKAIANRRLMMISPLKGFRRTLVFQLIRRNGRSTRRFQAFRKSSVWTCFIERLRQQITHSLASLHQPLCVCLVFPVI